MTIIVGTADGIRVIGNPGDAGLRSRNVSALAAAGGNLWAITGRKVIWRGGLSVPWTQVATLDELDGECLLPVNDDLYVGTSGAHLLRLRGNALENVTGFDAVDGRDSWYTPWGGPADCRSMTFDGEQTLYVNVHVGGIIKSSDRGDSWHPSGLDIHSDAHQVLAGPADSNLIFAAAGRGLATSNDLGKSWNVDSEGMHSGYCRAVAATSEHVLVSASDGPNGRNSCLYRRRIGLAGPFEKCVRGLPDWFGDNIDTGLLAADGRSAAFATLDGRVFASDDDGSNWRVLDEGQPAINCLVIAHD